MHSLRCKEDLKEEGFVARNPWQEKRKLQKQKGRERKACSSSYPWTWTMKWMTSGSDNSGIRLRLCVLLRFIGIRWHSRDVKKRNFQIQAMLSFFSPFLGCECEFYTIYGLAHSMITHLWLWKAHQALNYSLKNPTFHVIKAIFLFSSSSSSFVTKLFSLSEIKIIRSNKFYAYNSFSFFYFSIPIIWPFCL